MITVLFVDDEPALLDVSRLYLEKTGDLKVDTCFSAEQAIEMLKERSYDVIVSDYEMPGINGIEFLKILRNLHDSTPFIIFTGRGREHVVIEALNSGADFYLQKGGDPKSQFTELIHKIRLAVLRERNERSLQITRYSVEKASVQIAWLDRMGRFIYANEASCRALGYSHDELLRMRIGDIDPLFPEEEWGRFVDRLRSHESMVLQAMHTRKDGQAIPVEVSYTYGSLQQKPIIFAYSWSARGQHGFRKLMTHADARCHLLADALAGLYFEVSRDGKLLFWNAAAASFIGHKQPVGSAAGVPFRELVLKGQQDLITTSLSRVAEGAPDEILQVPLRCHDGTFHTFLFRASGSIGLHEQQMVQLLEISPEPPGNP